MKLLKPLVILLFVSLWMASCSTTPTGRKQLRIMPSSQMSQMGDQSFTQMKAKQPSLPAGSDETQRVRCITNELLKAMGENPSEWQVEVFKDDSPNAFALPGKNVGVHTGMMDLVNNDDQLAAVIGHEIGHVLAHHGNERVSQQLVTQAGLAVTQIALGQDSKTDQMILAALGVGAQFGYLLPFSRKQETEADRLGIKYMAKAGFNPKEAAELWKLMKQKSGGSPPEFLSTHPSPSSRIKDLSELAPQYMQSYQNARKPEC